MPSWTQNIFLIRCLNIKKRKKNWISSAKQWQKEIDAKQAELDRMYKNFEAEQVMLSDELKKKREDELFIREKELRDLQRNVLVLKGTCLRKGRNS